MPEPRRLSKRQAQPRHFAEFAANARGKSLG
jgi:hypothetical protein